MDDHRKNYRLWDADQNCQAAVSPRAVLPEGDLVFFLIDLLPQDRSQAVPPVLRPVSCCGQPPFDVTMMVTLLVYAYSVGVCSSPEDRGGLRAAAWLFEPLSATIRLTSARSAIFARSTRPRSGPSSSRFCAWQWPELGMVKLGNPVHRRNQDARANASRHKAMSYGYMNKEIDRLEAEIDQLLKHAEELDADQDAALGSRRGDELPDELKRREQRLAKIKEAKARLEAKALAKAEEEQQEKEKGTLLYIGKGDIAIYLQRIGKGKRGHWKTGHCYILEKGTLLYIGKGDIAIY